MNEPFDDWISNTDAMKEAATKSIRDVYDNIDQQMEVQSQSVISNLFNNTSFGNAYQGFSQLVASRNLYSMGRDISEGSSTRKIIDNFIKRGYDTDTVNNFDAVLQDVQNHIKNAKIIPGSEHWSVEQLGTKSHKEISQAYHYVTAQNQALQDQFNVIAPETPLANALTTYKKILAFTQEEKAPSDKLMGDFLRYNGVDIFDESKYGKLGSPEFMRHFGYYDNKWNPMTYEIVDPKTGDKTTKSITADEARRAFVAFSGQIAEILNMLTGSVKNHFRDFMLRYTDMWKLGDDPNPKLGDHKYIADLRYTYRFNSVTGKSDWELDKVQPDLNPGGDNNDFSSSYKSQSAAPKQLIVKIENLMNVKSIDLTNPGNVAVIANLKEQLAQTLIDVVHDFDDSFHG
jgi:hypothetical protein